MARRPSPGKSTNNAGHSHEIRPPGDCAPRHFVRAGAARAGHRARRGRADPAQAGQHGHQGAVRHQPRPDRGRKREVLADLQRVPGEEEAAAGSLPGQREPLRREVRQHDRRRRGRAAQGEDGDREGSARRSSRSTPRRSPRCCRPRRHCATRSSRRASRTWSRATSTASSRWRAERPRNPTGSHHEDRSSLPSPPWPRSAPPRPRSPRPSTPATRTSCSSARSRPTSARSCCRRCS